MAHYQGVVQERRKVRSLASGGCYVDKIAPKSRRTLLKTATAVAGAVAGTSLPALASAAPAAQGAEVIKIVSSLPLTGPSYGQSISVVNAIRMAIEEAGRKSGNFIIEYEALDDATAAAAKWMAEKEAENANKALNDPDTMVYIGTMNSGAAKVSIPILNQANLVMISPANTYPGLTKPGKGEANEPDVYYPSGSRNYTRVVPADDLQGAVGANWAKKLGAKTAYVIDDTELYGKGIADVFVATAEKIGIKLVGRSGIDGKASDYRAVATNVRALKPDAVYFGGITDNNAAKVLRTCATVGSRGVSSDRTGSLTPPSSRPPVMQLRVRTAHSAALRCPHTKVPPRNSRKSTRPLTTLIPRPTPSTGTRQPRSLSQRSLLRVSRTAPRFGMRSLPPRISRASSALGVSMRMATPQSQP